MRSKPYRQVWLSGALAAGLLALAASAPQASAQATRTWVSGVGDDANPCSRTAPCATLRGALRKTAFGGEIDALDPGDFGAVTITRSLIIDGSGTFASVQANGTDAVIVNAGPNDRVSLRGLSLNGGGSGINGVHFIAGRLLVVENTAIAGFTGHGIDFEPAGGGELVVSNAEIRDNVGSGVLAGSSGGSALVNIENSRFSNNALGVNARSNTRLTLRGSTLANNSSAGLQAQPDSGTSEVDVEGGLFFLNGVGILASGQATVRLSDATIENNMTGTQALAGGQVVTFANNQFGGNDVDVSPSTPTPTITPLPTSTPPATSTPVPTSTSTATPAPPGRPPPSRPAPTAVLDHTGDGGSGGGASSPGNTQSFGPPAAQPIDLPGLPLLPPPLPPEQIVPPIGEPLAENPPPVPLALPASLFVEPLALPASLFFETQSVAVDALAGAVLSLSDGNLSVGVPPNPDGTPLSTAVLDIEPVPNPWDLPPPGERLRLLDMTFTLTLRDVDGAPTTEPVSIAVRPTLGMADAVGGDLSQLVIVFLDDQGSWQALPTALSQGGTLSAVAPGPGTFGIARVASTFWVAPLADTELFGIDQLEVTAVEGDLYLVGLPDGTSTWIDASQVVGIAAPDALPAAPPPVEPAADEPT